MTTRSNMLSVLLPLLATTLTSGSTNDDQSPEEPSMSGMMNVTEIAHCIVHSHTDDCLSDGVRTTYVDFNRCCDSRCKAGTRMFAKPRIYSPHVNSPYISNSSFSFHCICCVDAERQQMGSAFGLWSTALLMLVTIFQTIVAFLLPKQEWIRDGY